MLFVCTSQKKLYNVQYNANTFNFLKPLSCFNGLGGKCVSTQQHCWSNENCSPRIEGVGWGSKFNPSWGFCVSSIIGLLSLVSCRNNFPVWRQGGGGDPWLFHLVLCTDLQAPAAALWEEGSGHAWKDKRSLTRLSPLGLCQGPQGGDERRSVPSGAVYILLSPVS